MDGRTQRERRPGNRAQDLVAGHDLADLGRRGGLAEAPAGGAPSAGGGTLRLQGRVDRRFRRRPLP